MNKRVVVKSGSRTILQRIAAKLDSLLPDNEEFGTFRHARSSEDSPTFTRYVVKTGIRSFDDRVGGMPIGKATELCGLPKSGKTNMALRTCVRAEQGYIFERVQTEDGGIVLEQLKPGTFNVTTLYYDIEGSLSDFTNRIVDGKVLDGEVLQCETVEWLWKTMDESMEIIDDEQEKNPKIIQFLVTVIDTVGSLTTKVELQAAWGKQDFPRVPAQLKAGFKAMTSRMQRENVLLIGLNHVSKKMTLMGSRVAFKGWAYNSPGGLAFSYFATHQVYFEMLQKKYCLKGKKGEADGLVIYFMTEKNRMLPPLRQCNLALLFGIKDRQGRLIREGGFNDNYSLLEAIIYGKAASVSKQTGAISFYFEKFGVPMTTFGNGATPSLEEQDDAPAPLHRPGRRMAARPTEEARRKKDPRIANRLAWSEFYEQHKFDLEALYDIVTDRCLQGSMAVALPGNGDDDDDEDEEEKDGEE